MQRLRSQGQGIAPFFEATSVALIGAGERDGSLGAVLLANLTESGFKGPIYPVNPHHDTVQDRRCYPSIGSVGASVDLAVIVTPAATVPGVLEECGVAGIRAAVVLSAGFRETGDEGRELEQSVLSIARQHGIRFIGPNCLGVMRPDIGLNATFSPVMAEPGRIALVSQSGAMCTAMLDWAVPRNVGFSCVISSGIAADVDFGEILDYLVFDPKTLAIMLYVEGVHDARRFMSALRAASRAKPVVVMKAGRYSEGGKAAMSHTGALVGSDDVFEAALSRAGAVRVRDYAHFFAVAETLHTGLKTAGPRLAIVTNGGGPGVIAADYLADRRLPLASLSPAIEAKLDAALPAAWSGANPVDVLGDASAGRYAEALGLCLEDPGVDSVLAILVPVAQTDPLDVARAVADIVAGAKKPVLTCWMGEASVGTSRDLFRAAGIPTYNTPEAAIEAFAATAAYHANQLMLLQVPEPTTLDVQRDRAGAELIIETALAAGRHVLDVVESKALLSAFGLPVVRSVPAHDAAEALAIAEEVGFPLVMKIHSPDITHKVDIGGVRLGIRNGAEVRSAFKEMTEAARRVRPDADIRGVVLEPMWQAQGNRELMLGVINDPAFGPAISVGLGGTMVEVIRDRAIGLPPLNRFLAGRLIEGTRAARYLDAFRGKPAASRSAVEEAILRLSEMICELPWIEQLDINPLIVNETAARAVDARVVVRHVSPAARHYSHMAIHPYPIDLVDDFVLADGTRLTIRPIRPEDAVLEREFVNGLSDRSRYLRFMLALKSITPQMVSRFTQIDYDREMALIALVPGGDAGRQVAVGRYVADPDGHACEFAIVVDDAWHNQGIATELLRRLIDVARERRIKRMDGIVLRENEGMLSLARDLGFERRGVPEDPQLVYVSLEL
jgi:acetyltransferase